MKITGKVVDDKGAPVVDAVVTTKRDDGSEACAVTDASGRFSLSLSGSPRSMIVHVDKEGFLPADRLLDYIGLVVLVSAPVVNLSPVQATPAPWWARLLVLLLRWVH